MPRSPAVAFFAAALAALPVAADRLDAQDPPAGSLVGMVYDSTAFAPLAGAVVAVIGTNASVETDAAGQFRLDGVPAGQQTVVFYHDRLAALGVSATPAQVAVRASAIVEVALAVPSRPTILRGWCAFEPGEGGASIGGVVTDSITGVPLPRARVVLLGDRFGVLLRRPVLREARTDNMGEYRLCNVDMDEGSMVAFDFGSSSAGPIPVAVADAQILDVAMPISDPVTIAGSVTDYATGGPVAGAHVQLVGTIHSEFTDAQGRFGFVNVPPGKQLISTTMLGYASRMDSLTAFSNEALGLEIELSTEAIALDPIVVTGRRRDRVFTTPGTRFSGLTEAQIDSIIPRIQDFAGLARAARMPGLSITERNVANVFGDPQLGVCIEMQRARATRNPNACNMVEVRVNDGPVPDPAFFLMDFNPQDVASMQFITPIEAGLLYGARGANGVLLIYTR